jgi:hypothetical protein
MNSDLPSLQAYSTARGKGAGLAQASRAANLRSEEASLAEWFHWGTSMGWDTDKALRCAQVASEAQRKGMTHAEAADAALATAQGRKAKVGKPWLDRLVRDASFHSVLFGALAVAYVVGFRRVLPQIGIMSLGGLLATVGFPLVGLMKAVQGWGRGFRLHWLGVALSLAALILLLSPAGH